MTSLTAALEEDSHLKGVLIDELIVSTVHGIFGATQLRKELNLR